MGGFSGIHWIIVLVIALLLFGRRLPEIMRGLGGSIREFKKGIDEGNPNEQFPDGTSSRQVNPPPAVNPPNQTADHREKTAEPAASSTEPPKQS